MSRPHVFTSLQRPITAQDGAGAIAARAGIDYGSQQELKQGIVDGSASKPTFRQDTGYMVEKTYHDVFGGFWDLCNASVTHIWFKKCFHTQKRSLECSGRLTLSSIWSKNHQFWLKTTPTDYMVEKSYHLSQYLGLFGAYFMPQGPKQGSKQVPIYQIDRWNVAINSRYIPSVQKAVSFG